jgi:Protein of unknown function (DUF4238)
MAKPKQNKKQHYIPESYLKSWCDPKTPADQKPYVWQISPLDRSIKRKAPSNIFFETDMYTIKRPDGERDLVLERGLSQLEGRFTDIRRNKLERHLSLSSDERFVLCAFVIAMFCRTPRYREWVRRSAKYIVDFVDKASAVRETATPTQQENIDAFQSLTFFSGPDGYTGTYETFKTQAENPIQVTLPSDIESKTPLLVSWFKMSVFETDDETGFVTSDCPCVSYDRTQVSKPYGQRESMFASKGLELSLPISPGQMLFFSQLDYPAYHNISGLKMYSGRVPVLDELNRRTCLSGATSIITRRNFQRDYWFSKSSGDPGGNGASGSSLIS